MTRQIILDRILARRLIAVVRVAEAGNLLHITEALLEGGIDVVEFSLTTPDALESLAPARERFGDTLLLGAGTVLDGSSARHAIESGAQFLVSPHFDPGIVEICHSVGTDLPVIPGALTPNEILAAWEAGADLVKIFPASLGGPRYIREVRAPLPQVQMVPTGGVSAENLVEYLDAGAAAVAAGSSLVSEGLFSMKDWRALSERAGRLASLASTFSEGSRAA